MNDITAVVLSIGEKTIQRAIESVGKQSVQPKEIIVIKNKTPFYKAINYAASKVKTKYFLEVDADMVLDKNCIEDLRKNMHSNIGITMGALRDPLIGTENGIKMFRKKCFEEVRFKNTISPDTDFFDDINKYGWKVKRISESKDSDRFEQNIKTFGDHLPEYNEVYTFRRYLLLGRRYHYRNDPETLKKRFLRLSRVKHKYSVIAQIALGHGIFSKDNEDKLNAVLYLRNDDFTRLEDFLKSNKELYEDDIGIETNGPMNTEELFEFYYKLGLKFKVPGSFEKINQYMKRVDEVHNSNAWIAKIGLAEGIFSNSFNEDVVKEKITHLRKLLI